VLPIRQGVNLRGQFSEDAWKLFVHSKISPRLAIALILVMSRPMAAKPQASPAPAAQTASSPTASSVGSAAMSVFSSMVRASPP
jgi:hypothetical protein